ncbi:hypothetical protein BB559_002403 [Furculomyces boomerangus]|uniref:Yeast cell wall synthesis Kre9/Knh1-like N-terminal domain-containing protein n=1 Tax=Furculomyces boomerangus TaxID=61424 RepID=A0A2T9YVJ1_9FUNG|nr:hypothetical protein BB559_002403 [Furculomyces boomerangus]
MITKPTQADKWVPGSSVLVSWRNTESDAAIPGLISIELFEGEDSKNMKKVTTIAENYKASNKQFPYSVPTDLPMSSHYSIRITESNNSQQHYSGFFAVLSDIPAQQPNRTYTQMTSRKTYEPKTTTMSKETSEPITEETSNSRRKQRQGDDTPSINFADTPSSGHQKTTTVVKTLVIPLFVFFLAYF